MKLNALLEDLTKVASGAAGALSGVKEQIDARRKSVISGFNTISREELEVVAATVKKARETQDALLKRIIAIEAKLGLKAEAPAKTAASEKVTKKAPVKKPAKKKAAPRKKAAP